MRIKLLVDENSVFQLKVGQAAVITVKIAPDKEFPGKITSIGAVAHEVSRWEDPQAVPGTRVFDVIVKITQTDTKILQPGISAKVQFVSARLKNAIHVPLAAVFDRPEGQLVYVRQGDKFFPRKVKTGERNDEAVVIREGLSAGEEVALRDPTREEVL